VTSHPVNGLDDVVHQRVRLGILTIAHEARRVEFSYLRANLELTAGNLSQHLGVLEAAGLITIEKGYAGKRARTWITLTKAGHAALAEEVTRLKLLISQIERADTQRS
jgi:DNA-binding MarR family transcriptional regulator